MVEKANFTNNKWESAKSVINLWLEDPTIYCNNCGQDFNKEFPEACCENVQLGRNFDHAYGLFQQNKVRREMQKNRYAATEDMTMRACVSLPPKLLQTLEAFFKKYDEKLFNNDKELKQFMRKFPQFTVPESI